MSITEKEALTTAIVKTSKEMEQVTPTHSNSDITTSASSTASLPDDLSNGIVASILRHGEENAIPCTVIAEALTMSGRELRAAVEKERRQVAKILSSDFGLFLPSYNPQQRQEELERFYRHFKAPALSRLVTLKLMQGTFRPIDGQLSLYDSSDNGKEE